MKFLFKYLFFSLASLLIFITSCRNNLTEETYDDKGNLVVCEWYNKQNIKSSTTYFTEDQTDYLFVTWFEDGRLMDSSRYVNDTLEGLRKVYDMDVGLMHYEAYQHGHLDGPHKAVYDNGVTSFEGFWKNYVKVGEWKFHFPEGNPITYEYYDSTGRLRYFRKYDEAGNVLKVEGSGLISVKIDQKTVKPTEDVKCYIESAIPPGCLVNLIIEVDKNKASERIFSTELKNPRFEWQQSFYKPGQKTFKFTIKIIDTLTQKEDVSSTQLNVTVLAE